MASSRACVQHAVDDRTREAERPGGQGAGVDRVRVAGDPAVVAAKASGQAPDGDRAERLDLRPGLLLAGDLRAGRKVGADAVPHHLVGHPHLADEVEQRPARWGRRLLTRTATSSRSVTPRLCARMRFETCTSPASRIVQSGSQQVHVQREREHVQPRRRHVAQREAAHPAVVGEAGQRLADPGDHGRPARDARLGAGQQCLGEQRAEPRQPTSALRQAPTRFCPRPAPPAGAGAGRIEEVAEVVCLGSASLLCSPMRDTCPIPSLPSPIPPKYRCGCPRAGSEGLSISNGYAQMKDKTIDCHMAEVGLDR